MINSLLIVAGDMPGWLRFKKRYHEPLSSKDEEKTFPEDDFNKAKKKYFTLMTCACLMLTLACVFGFIIIFIWLNYSQTIDLQNHYLKSNSCVPFNYDIEFVHRSHGATAYKGYLETIVQMPHNITHVVTHCNKNKYNILYGYDNNKNRLEKK